MSSGPQDAELTLPVSNLEAATKFYLRVLRPLRFEVISDIQHRARKGPTTRAVALGPGGSQTTVLFLSESDVGVNRTVRVALPVSSRCDVRDIYTSALETGVTAARKPAYSSPHGSIFTMSFRDRDGNTFEAYYNDAVHSPSEYADESSVSGHARNGSPIRALPYRGHRDEAQRRSTSPPSKEKSGPSGNAVIGTLIGAAAGVALGYAAWKGKADSRSKENEHKARLQARQLMEEEARANTYDRQSTGVIEPPFPRSRSRRSSYAQERDSGYSSFGRDESPKRIAYRSGTWPNQTMSKRSTSVDAYSTRRSSKDHADETGRIEYRPTSSRSGQDKQSEASSQRTIRIGTQISRSNNVSRPPSPPTTPISRPRRSSSVKYRHTVYGGYEDNDRRSVTSNSRKGSVANTLPPSSFPKRKITVPAPPSTSDKSSQITAIQVDHPTAPVDQPPPFREPDPSKLDDLETVVPDDSISCVGSERDDDRRSRSSRQPRRYRSPKRSNRGVDIVRRAGIVLK